jgi:2-polyprenyl-6-methoxyphenol hydroxylase-like FAD-dependent oxidoreductase
MPNQQNSVADIKPIRSIAIIGGGIGGLALGHLLLGTDYKVTIYERDVTPKSRQQGFYIGLNLEGQSVLQRIKSSCSALEKILHSDNALTGLSLLDENLKDLLTIRNNELGVLVSRWGLREALTQNLNIEWNKRFEMYEELEDRIVLHFEDGTTAEADFLIGADGARSRVRKQCYPTLQTELIHIMSIGGTIPLSKSDTAPTLKNIAEDNFLRIFGREGHSLLLFSYFDPHGEKRFLWAISWPHPEDRLNISDQKDALQLAVTKAKQFFAHKDVAALLQQTPVDEVFLPRPLRSLALKNVPKTPTKTGRRVTLLGDAAHLMTTHRGLGANTALLDALDLATILKQQQQQQQRNTWLDAIAQYEIKMFKRGIEAVKASLTMTRIIHARGYASWLRNWVIWTLGRLLNLSAAIRRLIGKRK